MLFISWKSNCTKIQRSLPLNGHKNAVDFLCFVEILLTSHEYRPEHEIDNQSNQTINQINH